MLIGVDARNLCGSLSGIGRYTGELLERMVGMGHSWIFYSHAPLNLAVWDRSNIKVEALNFTGRIPRMIWAQTYLPLLANNHNIDIFWSPAHRIPGLLSNSIVKVVTIHDLVWRHAPETMRPLSKFMDSLLMPLAVDYADAVIAVSEHTKMDIVKEIPNSAHKISTIPLGHTIRVPVFSGISRLPQNVDDKNFILFVGTHEPRKNLKRLLEAYSTISPGILGSLKLVIVGGEGWGGVSVVDYVKRFNLGDRVIILGYVDDEVLRLLYKSALLLVMPSLYEGFGLPLLEAMSAGTPVLTSNCSSMPEVVGDAAILVDPQSIDSIRDGIVSVVTDEKLRINLTGLGLKQSSKFDWDVSAAMTLKVFEDAYAHKFQKINSL